MTRKSDRFDDWPGFDELRAADPAAGLAPPTEQIWAAVRGRIDADGGAAAGTDSAPEVPGRTGAASEAVSLGEQRERRTGRGRGWLLPVAAGVAGALVVGGAAFGAGTLFGSNHSLDGMLGSGSASDSIATASAPTVSAESEPSPTEGAMAGGELGTPDSAGGLDPRSPEGFGGDGGIPDQPPTVFTAEDLGTGETSAMAYSFDVTDAFSAPSAERAAAAFGVSGTAVLRSETGSYELGPRDQSAPSAQLQHDSEATFSFDNPLAETSDCSVETDGERCSARDLGDTPSADEAIRLAREVLSGVLPGEDFDFSADNLDPDNPGVRSVGATRLRGGQVIGHRWVFQITGGGIFTASGPLAEIRDQGEHALITPDQAVQRLNDPQYGGRVLPTYDGQVMDSPSGVDYGLVRPNVPAAGEAVPWPVKHVDITDARLSVGSLMLSTTTELAVPVYVLSSADGERWSVIAVADEDLAVTDVMAQ